MRLKPKLLNAIILGLTMFLSMQTTCAACNPLNGHSAKEMWQLLAKKRVAISKKRVVKSKEENLSQGFGA